MRSDLHKVICETRRIGDNNKKSAYRRSGGRKWTEDSVTKESMRRRYGSNKCRAFRYVASKDFGENLSPLYRLVEKNVGKRFDDLYSAICKRLPRNVLGLHAKKHFLDYFWQGERGRFWGNYGDFYVNEEGLICKNHKPSPKDKKKVKKNTVVTRIGTRFLTKNYGAIDLVWVNDAKYSKIPWLFNFEDDEYFDFIELRAHMKSKGFNLEKIL